METQSKNAEILKNFTAKMRNRNLADSTIKTYTGIVSVFLNKCSGSPDRLTSCQLSEYINQYQYNAATMAQVRGAIMNLYNWVFNQKRKFSKIPYPKQDKKLPNILSVEAVINGIKKITNIKHKCIIKLLYGCGFRRSEVINMKPSWIDRYRGIINIRQGKGRKDRIVMLDTGLLTDLEIYYRQYKPVTYMFNGPVPGKPYSARSIENICHKYMGTNPHTLRHSFATHLHDAGTDIKLIKELLGHSHIKTTEIYTHVSTQRIQNLKSPLKNLNP